MTYSDIINWGINNLPISWKGDSYSNWISELEREFLNSSHFLPNEIYPLAEKAWLKKHDRLEPKDKEDIAPPPPPEEPKTIGGKLSSRFDRLPADIEFTPKQIANWTGFNKNTVRRELQEFVAEGRLQRIEKGRYRLA